MTRKLPLLVLSLAALVGSVTHAVEATPVDRLVVKDGFKVERLLAIQVFIGGQHERRSLQNLTKTIDAANRYGIAVMGVTAVGRSMERTPAYFRMATRIMAELGCHILKCYYTYTEFDTVTSCCPVPIVIAGGKKRPEREALQMAYDACDQGASGVDMGRNIFQSDNPVAMMKAVRAVVHEGASPSDGYDLYEQLKGASA